ncbi:hypothetical protein [Thiorhodococcus fuscus]|uniref:Uncharacterized protein n=1 Tax=Thiorhodococcus fuscus TaxID=527200 RepID=A0ABW4YE78_9GAMM
MDASAPRHEAKIADIEPGPFFHFSYLDMASTLNLPVKIFEGGELMDAFAMAQAANFFVREHSPFVVVELKSAIV